jgi:outer membrane protein OmpA-like peptidoglycan-associated protein
MTTNMLSLAQSTLGNDFSRLAGGFLGESTSATQSAMTSLLPAVLGGIARKGSTPEGASELIALMSRSGLDAGSLSNIAGLFGNGGSAANALMKAGTNSLVPALLGDKSGGLVSALSSVSGIRSSSATNLIAMVVPIVLMLIKKLIGEKGLNPGSLSSLLAGQGPHLQGALDNRILSALGFANPAAFLGGVGSTVAAAGSTVAAASSAGLNRWWPWLVGAAVIALLWWMLQSRSPAPAPTPVAAPRPAPAAPAPAPQVMAAFPAKVYFDTGSAAVSADGTRTLATAVEAIKKDGLRVAITGYTDKTGDTAKNEELAKSRALAVRDALTAGGVPAANIELRAPMFVEIGGTVSDAEARRVEISRL